VFAVCAKLTVQRTTAAGLQDIVLWLNVSERR
jgi:hypothetical protein